LPLARPQPPPQGPLLTPAAPVGPRARRYWRQVDLWVAGGVPLDDCSRLLALVRALTRLQVNAAKVGLRWSCRGAN
jgi:hypothetical protein